MVVLLAEVPVSKWIFPRSRDERKLFSGCGASAGPQTAPGTPVPVGTSGAAWARAGPVTKSSVAVKKSRRRRMAFVRLLMR